jgi:hypothetical protein
LQCVDNSNRTATHASINDNDALADQKETLDHIQRGVMNRNYHGVHIFSGVSFAILGRPSTIPSDFLTLRIAYSAKGA